MFQIITGLIALGLWLYMMRPTISEKIANSKFWPLGWIGVLLLGSYWVQVAWVLFS